MEKKELTPQQQKKVKIIGWIIMVPLLIFYFKSCVFNSETPKKPEPIQQAVINSSYDGSVWQVEDFVKKIVKDPDSYQGISWGTVISYKSSQVKEVRKLIKNTMYMSQPGNSKSEICEAKKGAMIYVVKDSAGYLNGRPTINDTGMNDWIKKEDTEATATSIPAYQVWHAFRSRNGFGGMTVNKITCDLDAQGNIVSYDITE